MTLQRLLLAGVKLTAPADNNVPQLWPLGLFDKVGTGLNISDVRLIVDLADFQQYLTLMQTLPRAVAQYHTVRSCCVKAGCSVQRRSVAWCIDIGNS